MRNLRAWLQDRSEEAAMDRYGSWPLANKRMANAPKLRSTIFTSLSVKAMWRDYDPAKTWQTCEMERAEKIKPVFRVSITNRIPE